MMGEVDKKVANDLCKSYDSIMPASFRSPAARMLNRPKVKSGRRRIIGSKTACTLLEWMHIEFRGLWASKVLMHGKELGVMTEECATRAVV